MSDPDRCKADKHGSLFMPSTIIDKAFKVKVINLPSVN